MLTAYCTETSFHLSQAAQQASGRQGPGSNTCFSLHGWQPQSGSFFFLIRSVWRSEKGMSGVDWKPLDLQGVTGSHRARNKGGKKNPTTFTASWRCAACLSRPLAPHHSCDKMLFSFLRCAQVPIQMNITHRPLSKHCAVFKG